MPHDFHQGGDRELRQLEALVEARRFLARLRRAELPESLQHDEIKKLDAVIVTALEAGSAAQPLPDGEVCDRFTLLSRKRGEYMVVRRDDGNYAGQWRCPRNMYYATAQILSDAEAALTPDEILSRVSRIMGDRPSPRQLAIITRLWLATDLVARTQCKYVAKESANLVASAAALWVELRNRREGNAADDDGDEEEQSALA